MASIHGPSLIQVSLVITVTATSTLAMVESGEHNHGGPDAWRMRLRIRWYDSKDCLSWSRRRQIQQNATALQSRYVVCSMSVEFSEVH